MEAHRSKIEFGTVSLLGNQNTKYLDDYSPEILESFINKHPENDYIVSFDAYEFTSKCVTGDTMIDVACNETDNPNGIPIKDLVGTEGYVFCVDPDTLQPLCRKYRDVRKTGENVPVVKVLMQSLRTDGSGNTYYEPSEIKCTPDHMILVKKGFNNSEWVCAKDLKPGMRLIADQRSKDVIRSKLRHRLVGEAIFDEDIRNIHHIDGNHYNNDPVNLSNLSSRDHQHLHRSQEYGYDNLDVSYLVDLYNSGENFHSIAKMLNCDVSTIESRIGNIVERRTPSESLSLRNKLLNNERDNEICKLYTKGYLLSEIADYLNIHSTTVLEALERHNIPRRESNFSRYNRKKLNLPPLNHKVIAVLDAGYEDVYNMEVEDVENYFANEVIVHNCPKTGQPDFAKLIISYIPNQNMVESKSLKLYLFSFRNHGDFHEDCINIIMKDLIKLMNPKYIEVRGIFSPRGGISIFPFTNWANPEFDYQDFARQRQLDALKDASNRTVRYDS